MVNGTSAGYVWDLAEGMPAILQDGSTRYLTGPGGLPIEQVDGSGTIQYYIQDQLGSTRGLLDASGTVVGSSAFTPYGEVKGHSGASTPFAHAGQYTDSESGLQYLRARYYDPSTAQFLTLDPLLGATMEPYGYAGGDALNHGDPSGLCQAGPVKLPFGSSNDCSDDVGAGMYNVVSSGLNHVTEPAYSPSTNDSTQLESNVEACGTGSWLGGIERATDVLSAIAIITPAGDLVDAAELAATNGRFADIMDLLAEVESGGGKVIAGSGAKSRAIDEVGRLVRQYGGDAADWSKVTTRKVGTSGGVRYQLHWYRNVKTGEIVEVKIKLLS